MLAVNMKCYDDGIRRKERLGYISPFLFCFVVLNTRLFGRLVGTSRT